METKAKLPKKLLSMFLAVLMAFSCFSLVMPELVPQANAADKNNVVNLINDAVSKVDITAASGNSWSFTVDHKNEYSVLLAARAIYDYAVNNVGTGSKSTTKLYTDTVSSLGVSGEAATLVKNVLDPGSNSVNKGDSAYTKSDANIDHGTSNPNHWVNQDISGKYNFSYNGGTLSNNTKSASITVDVNTYITTLESIAEIPSDLITGYSVSFTNTAKKSAIANKATQTKDNGCDDDTYYTPYTSYQYHEISANSGKDGAVRNIRADFQEYIDFFTEDRLSKTAADFLTWTDEQLQTEYDTAVAKFNSLKDTYGTAVASQFFDFEAINTYVNEVTFAQQVVKAQPTMAIALKHMTEDYDKNNLAEMEADYAAVLEAYNVFKGYAQPIFDFVVANYDGYDGFSKAAVEEYLDTLDYDIQFYNLTEFKNDVDTTIEKNNPKLADPLNETDITNGELSAIIGQVNGYYSTITPYRDDVEAAVFTDGTDYIRDYQAAAQLKLDSRGVQANFDTYWEYFLPLIYAPNLADLTKDELKARYDADTAEQAKLNKTYGENENLIGADLTKTIYTIEYTIGNETQVTLPQAVADYISRLGGVIRAKNNAQLDNVKRYASDENGNYSDKVTFENFVGLKTAIDAVDTDFYNYALSKGLVGADYQTLYGKLSALLSNYEDFVASGGLNTFKQHHYHDENGVYVVRLAGDQGVENDYPNDIAREGADDNYEVNISNVNGTIEKLDGFITSTEFGELLGLENAAGEITDLPAYLDELINTSIYSDDLINMLVGAIFPAVSGAIEGLLADLIGNLGDFSVTPNDSNASAGIDIAKAAGTDLISGTVDIYLDEDKTPSNGNQLKNFPTVFAEFGLKIYPSTFADSLVSSGFTNTSSDMYKRLKDAGRDWSKLVVADNPETEDIDETVALDFEWGVKDYNTLVKALGAVFDAILPVLQAALCGKDYSDQVEKAAFVNGPLKALGVLSSDLVAYGTIVLGIPGLDLYADVLGLLFETLGVSDGIDVNNDGQYEKAFNLSVPSQNAGGQALAKSVLDPIFALIDQLTTAPITKVMEMLPSLIYFLSMDKVTECIEAIDITLTYQVKIDVSNASGTLIRILNRVGAVKEKLDNLVSGSKSINVAELLKPEGAAEFKIADLIGFDLTNINAVIKFVVDLLGLEGVTLPTINAGEMIQCANYKSVSSITTSGSRNRFYADKADVFYFLLTYLVDAVGNQEFVDGIFDFIAYSSAEKTLDTDGDGVADAPTEEAVEAAKLTGPIVDLLNVVIANASSDPDGVLAALVELFAPQRYGTETIDWKESRYNYGGIEGVNAATLMYLDYSNDWTKEKATYLIENIDALVSSVLKMAGQEEVEVNALIQDMFDELFSNINITGLVKAVSSLGTALGDNDIIYSMLDDLGADFKSIYNAFGYLFVTELDRLEEGFVEPLKPGDNGYNNPFKFEPYEVTYEEVTELNESGEEVTVIEKDENGQPILDGEGNPIVRKKVNVIWKYDGVVFDEEAEDAKEIFVDILCETLAGFSGLLGAFFRGDSVGLFNGSIEILGYPNYADSIGLFFEILGIEGVMDQDEYAAYCAANGDTAALSFTVKQLFNWVDGYLLTGNTVQKIIEIVPNLIYFVESNGLSVVLHNLLMPVLVLIDTVRPILDVNLNGLLSTIVSDLVNGKSFSLDSILALLTGTAAAAEDEDYKYISIDVGNLTITEIVKILDAILGTNLAGSQLGTYGLDGFCSGVVEYDSVITTEENELKAYKSTIDAPDAITILISALLEAVEFKTESGETNGEILCDLIQGMMEDDSIDVKAIYTSVIDLIKGVKVDYQTPNWGYMFENPDDFSITLPAHTINYLDYSTDWTEDKAIALEKTLDDVIKMVLETVSKEEGATIATLLNGVFNDKIYSDANLTMMVEGIVNLIAGLDETLRNTIDTVIDTDIASWFEMCDAVEGVDEDGNATVTYKVKAEKDWGVDAAAEEDKREMFVTGLYEVLMPAQRLLAWFLFGDDFAFFTGTEKNEDGSYKYNDIITLTGGRAYDYALVPILEALGIEMPAADTFYITDANGNGTYNVGLAIDSILESVFNLIDKVSANPTKGVLDLLVNLLYFINADGIKTSVNNILAPIDALIAKVSPLIEDLNGATTIAEILDTMVPALDGIDISDLTMKNILGIINAKTGLVMSKEMVDILLKFYVGKLEHFDSANGNDAYRMVYTDEECYHDMLTIVLAFAIDLVKQNGPVITELLGEDIYAVINALLTPYTVNYQAINWGYMYGNKDEEGNVDIDANNAALADGFKAVPKFQYLKYATDWTPAMAEDVYAQLNSVITYALGEFADGNSIAQLLQGVMEDKVYTEQNLKTVVELLVNALASLDRSLAETIGILLDADISTWFDFCEEQEVDGETKYVCTKVWGVDTAADKKAVFVDAIQEILVPANRLLNWLFFEGTFTFFKDATGETLITLTGGKGYELGIVPILEALGCDVEAAETFYDAQTGLYDVGAAVESILDSVLALVDEISANPAKEAMTLIPNLLYFINADGLKASVNNLLAPVEVLLSAFGGLLSESGEDVTLSSLIDFELDNLSTETLLGLLEGEDVGFVMNDDMKAVIENIFALGVAEAYTSANGKTAYRVDVDGKEYDVLTVVLSFAIDAFKLNKALFADLLPEGVYDAVITLIAGLNIKEYPINWAYMYSGNMDELERSGFPGATITYLDYTTDWTAEAADSVYGVLADILDLVLPSVIEDGDLKALVEDLIAGNLYKTENLETIVEFIVNLLAGFDTSLRNAVGAVLDVNIASWFSMCEVNADGKYVCTKDFGVDEAEAAADKKAAFVAGLKEVLAPANELLSWLFFGESYTFFNGTTSEVLITVNGGNGYAYGLVPILEALGLNVKKAEAYKGADGKYNVGAAAEDIINEILTIVDKLGAAESTVEYVFTLLPNLLYFINADGLKASVNNLVAPVDAIIGCLSDVVGAKSIAALLTETIGFDISNLETSTLLTLLKEKTGFAMNSGMRGAIYNIYEVGKAQKFTSENGEPAYKLVPDMGDTLTVILSFVLDAFNLNEELFADLLGEEVYSTVATLIKGLDVLYTDINWGYMYEKDSVEANNKALAEGGFPAVSFQYLEYSTDWTPKTAEKVYGELNDVLAYLLGEFADGNTIAQLLSGILNKNVYTDANLNAIVELIVNAIFSLDAGLLEIIGGVDSLLDADINVWKKMCTYDEEAGKYECTKAWGVDGATDKKAAFVAGLKEVLAPANELLAWLFFEDDYTFFNGTTNDPLITISGGKGYELGLVPILEALGCEIAPAESFYNDATKTYDVGAAVESILDSALALVDKISANPAKEAMTLIPNLLYFINADGLKESVNNLLAPVNAVISALSGIVDVDSLGALLEKVVGFNVENLSTETLLGLLTAKTGFVMNEDMKQVIYDIYGLGTADDFTSANGKIAYRVDVREYDALTAILSFAIDAFKLNKALFADLLPEGVYDAIVELIAGINIDAAPINWGYMYEKDTVEANNKALAEGGFPGATIKYLEYSTDWTADAADSVYAVLDDVLTLVLDAVIENGDLKKLVNDLIAGNLYKTENLETIVELIVNLLAGFDESLRNVVDAVLDVNIASWFSMCEDEDKDGKYEVIPGTLSGNNRKDFIAGLTTVLKPAEALLNWLFFGESYTFFNGTTSEVLITVNGGKGYAYGILPILEALGVEGLQKEYRDADGKLSTTLAVEDILNKVLDLVDTKLTSSEKTVEFAFTLIPNLLYFINADGLKVSVNNLVAPVDAVIRTLSGVIGEESLAALLTDVIGIDISNLETRTLLTLLEEKTGFVMNPGMRGAIYNIYEVGKAQKFTSVNGKPAYKLVPDMGDALTVILSFALDAFNLNKALFADLLGGEDKYDAIYKLIRGAKEQFVYQEIDWGYMFEGTELADRLAALEIANGKMPKYPESSTAATYLLYGNNWNKETAKYVNDVVDSVVAGIMGETSLGQMLDNAITNGFYQDEILDSLIELVVELLVDYAGIVEGAGALLGAESIKEWFSAEYVTIDAAGNATCVKDWGVDAATTNEAKKEAFVKAFVEVLEPAYGLLAWLLFDQEFTFFNGTTKDPLITLTGGRGYEEALVPLFEAVGAKMPGLEDKKYENGETAMKPASAYVTANGVDMEKFVFDIFSALTGWLSQICGDLANQGEYGVIGAMLDLLPNVIYNINAGTVKAVVNNLLLPVEEILGHLEAFGLTVDFSTLVEIRGQALDITDLDWYSVFDILESFYLYWPEKIQDFLATLYIGEAVAYKSANGKTAYYMTYNADDKGDYLVSGREDMITLVISFVIDGVLDTRNAPRLSGWLGEDAYNVIYRYLANEIIKVPMQDIDWALLDPVNYADTGIVISPITLGAKINSEFYGELYTREMGEYIEKWLPSFVDSMIVLLGVQSADGTNYEGLSDILNELIGTSLYTKENLQKILDLIKSLIPKAEEALGAELFEVVVNVLDKALDIDLTYWNDYTVADIATGDREAFVDELTRMLAPLYPVLSWLLTDEDLIALFYTAEGRDALVIEGAEGYAYGIIPLLEAFDYDSEKILTPEEFKAASTDAPSMLKNILNPVLDVVDTVLADPVNEIFNVLPGVIYFLNSNGLDTVIKNTANAVFTVLENIEPLTGEIDIYELIGFDAENINIETLISELIKGLEEDTGFQLTEVAMEALKELTVGKLISFTSKNGKTAYTVEYATGADRVDMVTVVLRTVLTFVSIPENVVALEGMLEGKLNEDGYKFLCSLLENFSQMAAKTDENGNKTGMDEIMYTVYQIFYAANVAAHSTEDWLAEFNGDYSFLNQLFKTSNLDFLRQIEVSLGDLLNKYTGDIIDDDEIVPNGFIAFFQKIADFFKKIGEFFKNLFK